MDEILTIPEVAVWLKIAERTVYAMAASGELPAFKIGGQWRVRRSDFHEWIDRLATRGQPKRPPMRPHNHERFSHAGDSATSDHEEARMFVDQELPVSQLTQRVSQVDMHARFVEALGKRAALKTPVETKPLELNLGPPIPAKVRVYMFNATRPPGGRPLGEHKVQLIVPGQRRGQRGSFDLTDDRTVLLVGYAAEEDVFILWDAGLYSNFAWSRNVQVKAETIIEAAAGKLATQFRQLRRGGGRPVLETVIAAPSARLSEAIDRRVQLTRNRLLETDQ